MMHHPCDRVLDIGDERYVLRFSLRSLALIRLHLGAKGPLALAAIMSEPSLEVRQAKAQTLFECMLLKADAPTLSPADLTKAIRLMAVMIEEAFDHG